VISRSDPLMTADLAPVTMKAFRPGSSPQFRVFPDAVPAEDDFGGHEISEIHIILLFRNLRSNIILYHTPDHFPFFKGAVLSI
jgi:hypothetical protein